MGLIELVGPTTDVLLLAVLVAVVLTTVVAPYLLAWAIPRAAVEAERDAANVDVASA